MKASNNTRKLKLQQTHNPLGFVGQNSEAPRSVGSCGPLASIGPHCAGTFRKQITDDNVFCKQITDDKAGYGTTRGPFQDYVTLFILEETFSDLKWALFDLQ